MLSHGFLLEQSIIDRDVEVHLAALKRTFATCGKLRLEAYGVQSDCKERVDAIG
jgi:hypothetical protein